MKIRTIALVFSLLVIAAALIYAQAGRDAVSLIGSWSGKGWSMLPDGSVLETQITGEIMHQQSGLFHGIMNFAQVPGQPPIDVDFTGYMAENKQISGVLSIPAPGGPTPVIVIGTAEAKLTGKVLSGTSRDFTDGSTSYFVVERDR